MSLSSGSQQAELNKVPGNLCLQPPPGEKAQPAGTLVLSTFPSAGSPTAGQGPRGQPAAGPARTSPPGRRALPHALRAAFQPGYWLDSQLRWGSSSAWAFPPVWLSRNDERELAHLPWLMGWVMGSRDEGGGLGRLGLGLWESWMCMYMSENKYLEGKKKQAKTCLDLKCDGFPPQAALPSTVIAGYNLV